MSMITAAEKFGLAAIQAIHLGWSHDAYLLSVAAFSAARKILDDEDRDLSVFFDDGNPNVDTYGVSA